ncbi:MAG: magnesium transporter [Anaerolineae bacterium]|nr:magnesium transporter [Caldilineales bacterium]MCX7854206.1 magnesium transporter [Caldilineales bacterium]MDW8267623.1 magnesium transporter [Anaerolineae bacterium]
MQPLELERVLAQLREALERDDLAAAVAILHHYHPADKAELFEELEEEEQVALLPELEPADSADILEELDDEQAAELVAALDPEDAIRIVDEMEPDEAADLLSELEPPQAEAVLSGLEDPEEVRPLLLHPEESAGGLMTSEFLALRRRTTAAEALEAIRRWKPEADIQQIFVVDAEQHLVGVVELRQLIAADPSARMIDIMDPEVISAPVGMDQEEVARLMARYDLLTLPVVDAENRLVGVVTIDDVVDVIEEEDTEDIQRFGGAQPLERPYLSTSPFLVMRKRVGWLLLLFLTATLTGSVMRHFEKELQTVVALAFFVPLLIGTGGNAGSQTTSTIIRALAVGEITLRDAFRTLWHELLTGFLLGGVMAVAAYVRALTWGSSPELALTVALAIFLIVLWANGLGSLLPLLAARLGIDPAIVSGPVMSTMVDATGLFIYFTIADIILGL